MLPVHSTVSVGGEGQNASNKVICPSPTSPISSDSEDLPNAFNDICLSPPLSPSSIASSTTTTNITATTTASTSIASSAPSFLPLYFTPPISPSADSSSSFDLSLCDSDATSDSEMCYYFSEAVPPSTSTCFFCNAPKGEKICSFCLRLCDDYALDEFANFRKINLSQRSSRRSLAECQNNETDCSSQFGSCRKKTTPAQRQLLESVFETQKMPLSSEMISRLLQTLGLSWNRVRLLKWFDNRKFARRAPYSPREPFLKKKLCTTEQERLRLEAVFRSFPFPNSQQLASLREDLCSIRPGWSHRRVVQWFTNKRKSRSFVDNL